MHVKPSNEAGSARLEPGELNPHDSLMRLSYYREYDAGSDLYYGDLQPCDSLGDEVRFVLPGYLSGSDYSGSAVEVSNHRLFVEEFGELDGVHNVYGSFDSYAVAIRLDVWLASADRSGCVYYGADEEAATCDEDGPCIHQMREWLDALESYPVADEEDLYRVEMEAADEAWQYWGESDFASTLRDRYPADIEEVDVIDSARFRAWFEELREVANVYWENETGNSAHVDLDRVAAQLDSPTAIIEAAEALDEEGSLAHGFRLEILRRVTYLAYCQACGMLVSTDEYPTREQALTNGGPSHATHERIALTRIVYRDEAEGSDAR